MMLIDNILKHSQSTCTYLILDNPSGKNTYPTPFLVRLEARSFGVPGCIQQEDSCEQRLNGQMV